MPQYMLSVLNDPTVDFDAMPETEIKQIHADVDAFNDAARQAGKWVFAGGLAPIESTTTVDNSGEAPVFTDGPYSESKEYLGGFWILSFEDLDEALEWAARGSKACRGRVEVRPFDSAGD
ncbi:MAG TPA: YciI family protein [Nocardioidaceae bacterium]|nr:YciI family protein [Nocardioidaceae bacterium]